VTDPQTILPLAGLTVLEFGHTILGPCCGMVLADLGAEVIKIEPPGGERTRTLKGFGSGYYAFFNRNKKSVVLDIKSPEGLRHAEGLIGLADVLIENMAPGAMERAGLGPAAARRLNPDLIYCSLKGFLPGPYGSRVALDEVVQMLSGLAYMTGPPGQPLRAGTSITDILGGVFGALGIVSTLLGKSRVGNGGGALIESALFETAAFLMGQHMAYSAQGSEPVPPMPARVSAWAVYELFDSSDGQKIFVGITSDNHWEAFCREFARPDLFADASLASNTQRIEGRPRLLPELKVLFAGLTAAEIVARCQRARLPCSPVGRPEDLFDDPHLLASHSLAETAVGGGRRARLPKLPIRVEGAAYALRSDPPEVGADPGEVLARLAERRALRRGAGERCTPSSPSATAPWAAVRRRSPWSASKASARPTTARAWWCATSTWRSAAASS